MLSETNDIDELPEDVFSIYFKTTDQYQWKDPSILDEYKNVLTKPILY